MIIRSMSESVKNASVQSLFEKIKDCTEMVPAGLLRPMTFIHPKISEPIIACVLNKVFASALQDEELHFLADKFLKLVVTDANLTCFITVTQQLDEKAIIKVTMSLPPHLNQADVEFSANTKSLMLLANKAIDPDTLFFQRKLLVTGKTELGLAIKNFLDDFDFRENLPATLQKALKRFNQLLLHPR